MLPPPPDADHAFHRVTPADGVEVRVFFSECADYVRLAEGREPSDAQMEDLFFNAPPGRTAADKVVLGVRDREGRLEGVLEVLRSFPEPSDWFLGLLLFRPGARGCGLGDRAYRALEAWAAEQGVSRMYLAVVAQNPRARAFWERQGFGEVHRKICRVGELDCEVARMVKRLA